MPSEETKSGEVNEKVRERERERKSTTLADEWRQSINRQSDDEAKKDAVKCVCGSASM